MTSSSIVKAPFCDFLRVTSPPDSGLFDDTYRYALEIGLVLQRSDHHSIALFRLPDGTDGLLRIEGSSNKSPWELVSVSGDVCEYLRSNGHWVDFLYFLYEHRCKVTIAHIAIDMAQDASLIIADLFDRYPQKCRLSQRALSTTWQVNTDDKGRRTGTFYVGKTGRPRIKLTVYDKRWEMIEKAAEEHKAIFRSLPDRTRYELKFRDVYIPLGDLADPAQLFYHYAAPTVIEDHAKLGPWNPPLEETWKMEKRVSDPYTALDRLLSEGHYCRMVGDLAKELPLEARVIALRRIALSMGIEPHDVRVNGSQALSGAITAEVLPFEAASE